MTGAATVPETVYAGIELERARLRALFRNVVREDGGVDMDALRAFQRALDGRQGPA